MNNKEQQIPAIRFKGYTDDWEHRPLGDITEVITKGTTPLDKSWKGPVNYVKTDSIDSQFGHIIVKANTSIEEHERYLKRSQLKAGDVLFSIVGTLGRVGIVQEKDLPANTNQQIAIIRLNKGDNNYVFNALKTSRVAEFIKSDATIGAQPSLSLWQIEKLIISYPGIKEQIQIGNFFNQLDNTIALYQRQQNNYKKLKQQMLKKIFSQELRFNDEDGRSYPEWENHSLSELGSFEKSYSISRTSEGESNLYYVHYGDIHSKYKGKINEDSLIPTIIDNKAVMYVKEGDIIFADASEDYKDLGKAVIVYDTGNRKIISGLHTHLFRATKANPLYIYYQTLTQGYYKFIAEKGTGISVLGISRANLESFEFEIPSSTEEQQKIADFLCLLDKNIDESENKLKSLKQQKKGFVQQMFI